MSTPPTTGPAPRPRTDPDATAAELAMLGQYLDYHRATLRAKCAGLAEDQLKRSAVPPSNLTLLGLVRHLTEVEARWSVRTLDGRPHRPAYSSDARPDGDFDALDSAPVAEVWRAYEASVAESQRVVASFTDGAERSRDAGGSRPSVRWVLMHLLEEYARHNGHADLLREVIDGTTGE